MLTFGSLNSAFFNEKVFTIEVIKNTQQILKNWRRWSTFGTFSDKIMLDAKMLSISKLHCRLKLGSNFLHFDVCHWFSSTEMNEWMSNLPIPYVKGCSYALRKKIKKLRFNNVGHQLTKKDNTWFIKKAKLKFPDHNLWPVFSPDLNSFDFSAWFTLETKMRYKTRPLGIPEAHAGQYLEQNSRSDHSVHYYICTKNV